MTTSILLKWTVLVWLNAIVSFSFIPSAWTAPLHLVGICSAVFTVIGIYAYLDLYLIKQGKHELRTHLLWSVCIKSLTQLVPSIEIYTGAASMSVVTEFLKIENSFFATYWMTMIDGAFLSLIVVLLVVFIRVVKKLLHNLG